MSNPQASCMIGGTGQNSYANNSVIQRMVIGKVKPLLEESIRAVWSSTSPELISIADLGCSSGPNALAALHSVIDGAISAYRSLGLRIPEFHMFLNDLPSNDFNTLFKTLPSFYREIEQKNGVEIRCFISGTPGSFYGRLFPQNLMHFKYSLTCLHWLSQAPKGLMGEDGKRALNKGCTYARKGCPLEVVKAYRQQFGEDFLKFLSCRSKEIVHGGRMVLAFAGTHDHEDKTLFAQNLAPTPTPVLAHYQIKPNCPLMEVTSVALYQLADEGVIDKEKLDGFNFPYYTPTIQQVKEVIETEGSFVLDKLDTFTLPWVSVTTRAAQLENWTHNPSMVADSITRSIRAIVEPLLVSEFGEEIMGDMSCLVRATVMNHIATGQEMEATMLVASLVRKHLS